MLTKKKTRINANLWKWRGWMLLLAVLVLAILWLTDTWAGPLIILYRSGWLLLAGTYAAWGMVGMGVTFGIPAGGLSMLRRGPTRQPATRRKLRLIALLSAICAVGGGTALVNLPALPTQLRKPSLRIASATLHGLVASKPETPDDKKYWLGSAFVTARQRGKLTLCTNRHCLGLDAFTQPAIADLGRVEITEYSIQVTFASGKVRPVLRVAANTVGIDLAYLEIAEDGLKEGQDYIVVPYKQDVRFDVGDRVIALGTPLDPALSGTHSFGTINAIRERNLGGEPCQVIQHGAAIHPGNSGGPLFLEQSDSVDWIGVNTGKFLTPDDTNGIFFSIDAREYHKGNFAWAEASPSGVSHLVRQLPQIPEHKSN